MYTGESLVYLEYRNKQTKRGKNMMKKFSVIAILMTMVFAVGCGKGDADQPETPSESSEVIVLEEKVQTLVDENKALMEENSDLKAQIEALKDGEGPVLDPSGQAEGEEELPIFGSNENGDILLVSSVVVKTDEPLINKMQFLADELSAKVFNNLEIKAKSIDTIEGKETLVVDLMTPADANAIGWTDGYFQGSTGGRSTETALIETFLQREYGGRWVEGVMFTLDGDTIGLDHVPNLSQPSFK